MCIAIWKPAGKSITKKTLETCFRKNPDGCGFGYIQINREGKKFLKISKTLEFKAFYRRFRRAERLYPESPFLIHFRIKTHGKINKYNCHPFKINNNQIFIHNGIISKAPKCDQQCKSDTQMFNNNILKKLPVGWENNVAIKEMIEDYIGLSKLVVLNIDGTAKIFNESSGVWDNDIWYSNTGYKVVYPVAQTHNTFPRDYSSDSGYYNGRYLPRTPQRSVIDDDEGCMGYGDSYVNPSRYDYCDVCDSQFLTYSLKTIKVNEVGDKIKVCRDCATIAVALEMSHMKETRPTIYNNVIAAFR